MVHLDVSFGAVLRISASPAYREWIEGADDADKPSTTGWIGDMSSPTQTMRSDEPNYRLGFHTAAAAMAFKLRWL